jgi:hypothetical protein
MNSLSSTETEIAPTAADYEALIDRSFIVLQALAHGASPRAISREARAIEEDLRGLNRRWRIYRLISQCRRAQLGKDQLFRGK